MNKNRNHGDLHDMVTPAELPVDGEPVQGPTVQDDLDAHDLSAMSKLTCRLDVNIAAANARCARVAGVDCSTGLSLSACRHLGSLSRSSTAIVVWRDDVSGIVMFRVEELEV